MRHLAILLVTSLTAATLSVAQVIQPEQRSLDEIYERARQEEGTLNVYFGGSCE